MGRSSRPDSERIVVTGLGVVSSIGVGVPSFHEGLSSGRDGITSIEFEWGTSYKELRAGRVELPADVEPELPPAARASRLALASAREALSHAGVDPTSLSDRLTLVAATTLGDATEYEAEWTGSRNIDRLRISKVAERIRSILGIGGPAHLVGSTCAAGNHAIVWAATSLRAGRCDLALTVASDTIGYVDMLGFTRLLIQAPQRIQPFDLHRKGTILAEGSGALVLETLEHAKSRNAPILAEVAGYGLSCDAAGPFASKVDDTRALRLAFDRALQMAGIAASEIDHVSAHASATVLNDQKETRFLKEVLGANAYEVPVNGIKSMLGHAQGAASALEAIASVLTLAHGVIYPTINYEVPDPSCDLDYVPNEAREQRVQTVLSNAFGVGGNNALVILRH